MGNSLSVQGKKGKGSQKGVVVTSPKGGKAEKDTSLEHGDVYKECDSEGLPENLRTDQDVLEGEAQTAQSPGYACSSVQGMRNGMEDQHVAARPLIDNHQGKHDVHLFGVFDGHGGTRCAQFLKQSLATAVKQSIAGSSDSVEEALRRAFLDVDNQFCQDEAGGDAREEGSTAVVVVIVGDTLYCANTVPPRLSLASALWRRPLCSCCLHASFLAGGAVLLSLLLSVRCSSLFRADAVLLVTCTPSPLLHSLSSLPSFPSVPSSSALSAFCSRVCWS